MCWLRWPNHIFQEKWHKARSYGTKNCLSKPKLSSVSKANLIFAEQTKTSNTGLAPVRVFREARCIHHHLFPVSARLSASVVPFSEQKVFSISWERVGGEEVIHWNREKRLCPALPILWSSNLPIIRQVWDGQPRREYAMCSHHHWAVQTDVRTSYHPCTKAALLWKHNSNKTLGIRWAKTKDEGVKEAGRTPNLNGI